MDRNFYFNLFPHDFDIKNKPYNRLRHIRYMLIRTLGMFEYTGLPDTIPQTILEMYLQVNGYAGITKHEGNLYCLWGGLGGEPDYNYRPTVFSVSNPALNWSANLKIGEECEIIRNDDLYFGLLPMYKYYAAQMAENELSMYLADINARIPSLIAASDDTTKQSAEVYLKRVVDGELGVIADQAFLEKIQAHPYSTGQQNQTLKTLIEYEQYLKASWFNELGLDANYNMKRETLTDSENEMNKDSLLPLIERMLETRKRDIERVNALYGSNITVDLAGQWKKKEEQEEALQEVMEAEADAAEQQAEQQEEQEDSTDVQNTSKDERQNNDAE